MPNPAIPIKPIVAGSGTTVFDNVNGAALNESEMIVDGSLLSYSVNEDPNTVAPTP